MEATQAQVTSIADLRPKMRLQGTVTETQLYGAIVDIGLEQKGLVHISRLAPTRVNRVTDVVNPGDNVTVWVTEVDLKKGRIGLTMVEPPKVEWRELKEGQIHTGTVTRLEPYGAFVDIGAERPGLLHVREMSSGYVRHPSEIVKVGDEIEVRILKLDRQKRRIDLAMANTGAQAEAGITEDAQEEEPLKTAMEIALQRAGRQPTHKRRRERQQPPEIAEREDILLRTLELHAKHERDTAGQSRIARTNE